MILDASSDAQRDINGQWESPTISDGESDDQKKKAPVINKVWAEKAPA